MTSEIQFFGKDKLRLNILREVLEGKISLGFQLGSGAVQDYASAIHEEGKRVYVCGKFNLSENANDGDTITVRPIMIDQPLTVIFHANTELSGKKALVVRGSTKAVEHEIEITNETASIELVPQDKQCYLVKVISRGSSDASIGDSASSPQPNHDNASPAEGTPTAAQGERELQQTEQDIYAVEQRQRQLAKKKQSRIKHLEAIETEYKKNYAAMESELGEIKSRMEADSSVIEHYQDQDIKPLEELFAEIHAKLDEAENQIRLFIEAKQQKTMEIENAIKSGKKK